MSKDKFPFDLILCGTDRAKSSTPHFELKNYKNFMLEYVVDGKGYVEYDNKKYLCTKDTVYLFCEGETYKYYHDPEDPWKKIYIIFSGDMARSLISAYDLHDKLIFHDRTMCRHYFERLLDARYSSPESALLCVHNIFHQLSDSINANINIPPVICELKNTVSRSISSKFSLNDFSAAHNVSTSYCIREFKKYYKSSPYNFLLQCRLENAARLLICSSLSIKEIAAMLNFNDQYYFSNLFKQKHGVSPKIFRKKNTK